MFPLTLIHQKALQAGLPYLVIGGHAVNVYAEPRATLDVDLLARRADQGAWQKLIEAEGFRSFSSRPAFQQFSPPDGTSWRLDFMWVNKETFHHLAADSRSVQILGIEARIPSPHHLIALKLHALKHGGVDRFEKDLADVLGIVRFQQINVRTAEFQELFTKYGTAELYQRLLGIAG